MLFSNNPKNGLNINDRLLLLNPLKLEKCYRIMCQQLNALCQNVTKINVLKSSADPTEYCHQPSHRWQTNNNKNMKIRHRTLQSNQWNTICLMFIGLLAIGGGQSTYVVGAHSRDNNLTSNIYSNNNDSVVNKNVVAPTNTDDKRIKSDLTIVDINDLLADDQYFQNVTDIDADDDYSRRSRKLKQRSPIYQNEFAVYVPNGAEEADHVANRHGFVNTGSVGFLLLFPHFSFFKPKLISLVIPKKKKSLECILVVRLAIEMNLNYRILNILHQIMPMEQKHCVILKERVREKYTRSSFNYFQWFLCVCVCVFFLT